MSKKVKSIIRIVLLVIAALIIGVNVYFINASRVAGNAVPMPFGVGVAVVLSGSMEPEFYQGDLLIITESETYEVGDIVVFQDGRMAVTHRIVEINEDEIITRGDANQSNDDPITLEQIKGKVVFEIRYVGYAVDAIKTPIGTVCILALAIFLVERSFHAEKQEDKKELDAIRAEIERLKQEQEKK